MIGPCPPGQWSNAATGRDLGGMIRGRRYAVVQAFTDYDGDRHAVGESWVYLGASFLPYEDGQSLFVSLDGAREWHIRLRWVPEEQGAILDAWDQFVGEAG